MPAPSAPDRQDLAALLRWYVDMGVDCPLEEAPVNRFAQSQAPPKLLAQFEPPGRPLAPSQAPPPPRRQEQLAQPSPKRVSAQAAPPAAARPAPPLSQDSAVASAREQAASAATLDELRERLKAFDGCALKNAATQLVFADGAPDARV